MKKIPLHGKNGEGKFTLVDDEDYAWAKQFRWYALGSKGYVARSIYQPETKNNRLEYLHRALAQPVGTLDVDHENGNALDNQRHNLRVCRHSDNQANRRTVQGLVPFRGVTIIRTAKINRYRAHIQYMRVSIVIGRFETSEEAAKAWNEVAIQLFGDFVKLNEVA